MKRLYSTVAAASMACALWAAGIDGAYLANYHGNLYSKGWNPIEKPIVVKTLDDGTVELQDFVLTGFNVKGTYDADAKTLVISGPAYGTYVKSYDDAGNPVMAPCAAQNSSDVSDDNDIILKIDPEHRTICYKAKEEYFEPDMIHDTAGYYAVESLDLLRVNEEGRIMGFIGYASILEMNAVNTKVSYSGISSSTGKPYDAVSYAYIDANADGTELTVYNAAPVFTRWYFDVPVKLAVDKAKHTATASAAAVTSTADDAGTKYLFWSVDDNNTLKDTNLTFTIEEPETDATGMILKTPAAGIAPADGKAGMFITNLCYELGSTPTSGGAGIADIEISDESAPVEYYTLQGIRVAEPTTGLYIRRQGSKATKVLVK